MTQNTTGISASEEYLEELDDVIAELGYFSRSEFFREAAKNELRLRGVDVDLPDE